MPETIKKLYVPYPDGTYEGSICSNPKCSCRSGYGKMIYLNGDIYEGNWKLSKKNGQGKMTYVNCDIYEGEWKNDKYEGRGDYIYKNGNVNTGFFKNGLKHGIIFTELNNKMELSIMNYNNNKLNGFGIIINYLCNTINTSHFENNKRHGLGKFYCVYDTKFINHFKLEIQNKYLEYQDNYNCNSIYPKNIVKNIINLSGGEEVIKNNSAFIYETNYLDDKKIGIGNLICIKNEDGIHNSILSFIEEDNLKLNKFIDDSKILKDLLDNNNSNKIDKVFNELEELKKQFKNTKEDIIKKDIEIKKLKEENKNLNNKIDEKDKTINDINIEIFKLNEDINKYIKIEKEYLILKSKCEKLKEVNKLKTSNNKLNKQIEKLTKELKKKEKEINSNKDTIENLDKQVIQEREWKNEKENEKRTLKNKIKLLEEDLLNKNDILEEYTNIEDTINHLSERMVDIEIKNNKTNKTNSFIINGLEYKNGHPNWNKKYNTLLCSFQSCLHDKKKILDLIKKCKWTEVNNKNHIKYTRITPRGNKQILVSPSTPSSENSWKRVWCQLKKYEIELILETI